MRSTGLMESQNGVAVEIMKEKFWKGKSWKEILGREFWKETFGKEILERNLWKVPQPNWVACASGCLLEAPLPRAEASRLHRRGGVKGHLAHKNNSRALQ